MKQTTCKLCGQSMLMKMGSYRLCSIDCYIDFKTHQDPNSDCILWPSKNPKAYGQACFQGQNERAIRFVYRHRVGELPDHLIVRHKCDNPPCCNPDHLELGTQADNIKDMVERGRQYNRNGEANSRAKISNDTALAIFRAKGLHKDIAADFGVSAGLVGSIKRGDLWNQVTGLPRRR